MKVVCSICPDRGKYISPILIFGNNEVLVIGESPKGDLVNSFCSPTFKKLAEELLLLGIVLVDCSLTELCKCEVIDRKHYVKMGQNCAPKLEKQIQDIQPKLIVSIGKTTWEIIDSAYGLNSTMGVICDFCGYKYLPLYHPSPINPHNHKRNLEIIASLSL